MNIAKELVDEALIEAENIETWRPQNFDSVVIDDNAEVRSSNCVAPWDISQPWQAPITSTSITLQPSPDFIVNVYKAENGFMVEINGKKYIAKKAKDIAELFIKQFDAE
jgi:hypothetical protein